MWQDDEDAIADLFADAQTLGANASHRAEFSVDASLSLERPRRVSPRLSWRRALRLALSRLVNDF